jgi:outer membrane protein assembly factor BamB
MAEVKSEIRLLALDGRTGKVLWSQQLMRARLRIDQDPVRRLAGVSPSYSDGVLVCPTGAGSVVALDPSSRSLLWAYVYPGFETRREGPRRLMNRVESAFVSPDGPVPRWVDGVAVVSGGRVLLTPAEADVLCCLDLADGKPRWPAQPRGEHLYIACVHRGIAALVRSNFIDAINLKDGSNAWNGRSIACPDKGTVSGHGFYSGNKYYLPLNSGVIATIDLDAGRIAATVKLGGNAIPGNLVCAEGLVVSQGVDGVETYRLAELPSR